MKRACWMVFLLLLVSAHTVLADEDAQRGSCQVCGMYTHEFADTAAELVYKDGRKIETCGMACMLRIVEDSGGPDAFSSMRVHDWDAKTMTSAKDATYVIGSRVIPDMIPNIIAFERRADAEAFRSKEGGEILDFTQALSIISPMGMTMPTRIKPAVLPPKGAFGTGVGFMKMVMDEVQLGSSSKETKDFARTPGQMMGPKEMSSKAEMVMVNVGLTDNLALGMKTAYLEKEMETYQMAGRSTASTKHSGMGDTDLTLRYSLWKDTYYRNFLSLLAGTSLPTGDFDTQFIMRPGLQLGTDAFGFTGGLLFSHRYKHLWFHFLTSYTTKLENDDDYQFGDQFRMGAALHYTPSYNLMMGLEVDGVDSGKNEFNNSKIGNTGGFRSALSAIVDWRFLTALGGNFSLRLSGGVPLKENMNHYRMGTMEKVQMGGGYSGSVMINFKRRFQVM